MVALLDFPVRVIQRLNEVIERGARADRCQVGADPAPRAADGVATHAAQFGPAVDLFATGRVSGSGHRLGQRADLTSRKRDFLVLQPGAPRQRQRQRLQRSSPLSDCPQARLGGQLGKPFLGQRLGQGAPGIFHAQQRAPKVERLRLGFAVVERLDGQRRGLVEVQGSQRGDRHMARLVVLLRLDKRLEHLDGLGSTGFADGIDRGLANGRRGSFASGEIDQAVKLAP